MRVIKKHIWLLALLLMMVTSGCNRDDLYVYGTEFHSLTVDADWSDYTTKSPDGMTLWFWPRLTEDQEVPDSLAVWGEPYRFTTASVQHCNLYVQKGLYNGVVVDYSPEEYSRQRFMDMDNWQLARVELVPDAEATDSTLYGDATVLCQPELMALDTLRNMQISAGQYGDYIPYNDRERYQQNLTIKEFSVRPQSLIWQLHLHVPVKGLKNVWQTEAAVSGLAAGHYLALHRNMETTCVMRVSDWTRVQTDKEGNGYIEATVNTFGYPGTSESQSRAEEEELPAGLQLNLKFTLRDRQTVCQYAMEIGNHVLELDQNQELRVWLEDADFTDPDLGGDPILLPYVEPYNGTGFGADVTPWQEGQEADVPM